ncbi:hypothetical protein L3X38_023097 [Prunus dulcis]|uniref:Uncharacterized protein n=1 Tax=Prunus dulcis TaxID=3755 RepID=A0AAD4VYC8_PRUDU|nr:hypothetical protein L3X38_023097 [Prunus dulcis]
MEIRKRRRSCLETILMSVMIMEIITFGAWIESKRCCLRRVQEKQQCLLTGHVDHHVMYHQDKKQLMINYNNFSCEVLISKFFVSQVPLEAKPIALHDEQNWGL